MNASKLRQVSRFDINKWRGRKLFFLIGIGNRMLDLFIGMSFSSLSNDLIACAYSNDRSIRLPPIEVRPNRLISIMQVENLGEDCFWRGIVLQRLIGKRVQRRGMCWRRWTVCRIDRFFNGKRPRTLSRSFWTLSVLLMCRRIFHQLSGNSLHLLHAAKFANQLPWTSVGDFPLFEKKRVMYFMSRVT